MKKRSHSSQEGAGGSNLAVRDSSPQSVSPCTTATPLSESPTSSISSAFSASSEDLLCDRSLTNSLTSPVHVAGLGGDPRFSLYDNFHSVRTRSLDSEQSTKEFHDIAKQISSLTSSIDTPDEVFSPEPVPTSDSVDEPDSSVPPLPEKHVKTYRTFKYDRSLVTSHYDNMPAVVKPPKSQDGQGVLHTSQSASSGLTGRIGVMYSLENFSSSETFSSSGTYSSSMESLQKPPPLPPKKKHGKFTLQISAFLLSVIF